MKVVLHLPDFGWPIAPEQLGQLAGLGIDTVIGRIDGIERRTPIEFLACYVLPAVTDMGGRR